MHWHGGLFALAALVPLFAPAQDIAPEVLLMSRIREHIRKDLAHLPDYTCVETIQRFRKAPGPKEALKALDTVRLEVLFADGKELFASPGDRSFVDADPSKFVGSGMMGTGVFAAFLRNLFVADQAVFTWRGEEKVAGQRSVRWDFQTPARASEYHITVAGASGTAGIKGSFWADPESLDVLRMSVDADDIPLGVPAMEVNSIVTYARVRVGSTEVMLPQTAVMRLLPMTFEEERNYMEFTHCQEFHAESSLSFGPPADTPAGHKFVVSATPLQVLPKGIQVSMALVTPVTGRDLVGSLISARILSPVRSKGKVLIPEGATLRGRIRRLEHYEDQGGYFVVGIEFTEIESDSAVVPFYADLQAVDRSAGIEWNLRKSSSQEVRVEQPGKSGMPLTWGEQQRITTEHIWANDLPGVGTFFVRGNRLNLPAGLKMMWKTVSASSPPPANR